MEACLTSCGATGCNGKRLVPALDADMRICIRHDTIKARIFHIKLEDGKPSLEEAAASGCEKCSLELSSGVKAKGSRRHSAQCPRWQDSPSDSQKPGFYVGDNLLP